MPPKLKVAPKVPARRGAAAAAAATKPPSEKATVVDNTLPTTTAESSEPPPPPPEQKPIAPPKGRLDSLASGRGGPGIRNSGGGLKIAPRVVARRSKEERERLDAKFEAAKPAATTTAPRPRGGSTRGARGGRGRGRGDLQVGASGPFALGSIVSGRSKVVSERIYGSGPRQKFSFGSNRSSRRGVKTEGGVEGEAEEDKAVYSSSEEEEDGQRMDVEYISLLDEQSDEDGDEKTPGAGEWGAGAPVRVMRHPHIDRQAQINTESSTRKGKAVEQERAKEMTFDSEIKIKAEPVDEPMLSSPSDVKRKSVRVSTSPELKRHGSSSTKPRRRSSTHKKRPVISTAEEQEESDRIEMDHMFSLHQLGGIIADIDDKDKGKGKGKEKAKADPDSDGDTPMGESSTSTADAQPNAAEAEKDRRLEIENQPFFFQFPQLLPQLAPVGTKTEPADDTKPKPDPANPTASSSTDPSSVAAPESMPPPKKLPSKKAQIKQQLATLSQFPPAGRVGTMRVHASGRVSMLWGTNPDTAIEMEVSRGTDCHFFQEVVVMKQESPYGDEDVDEKGNRKGVAYSLGAVKGRYVVAADFEKLIAATSGKGGRKKGGAAKREKEEPVG